MRSTPIQPPSQTWPLVMHIAIVQPELTFSPWPQRVRDPKADRAMGSLGATGGSSHFPAHSAPNCCPCARDGPASAGGWGGIRTHEELAPLPVFKTGAFNRSATHPVWEINQLHQLQQTNRTCVRELPPNCHRGLPRGPEPCHSCLGCLVHFVAQTTQQVGVDLQCHAR